MIRGLFWLLVLSAQPGLADTVLANRTIRPTEVITASDLALHPADQPGTYGDPDEVIGQEARVALYPGRPIRRGDLRPPALIERNAPVLLVFQRGGLEITTEGRALDRAAVGETVRVLNAASRSRVLGQVLPDGRVLVE